MNKRLVTLLLIAFSTSSFAQIGTLSPYSIYGLGDDYASTLTAQSSMGHTGIAVLSPSNVNTINPATLSQINRMSFNFDVKNEMLTLNNGSGVQSNNIAGINNISLAFPLVNKYNSKRDAALAFGIKPLTSQGYDIETTETISGLGEASYRFIGNGGLTDAFLGLSYDLLSSTKTNDKRSYTINKADVLSLGLTGSYILGTLDKSRITQINQDAQSTAVYRTKNLVMSDVSFKAGALYTHALTKSEKVIDKISQDTTIHKKVIGHFSVGAFYTPSTGIGTRKTENNFTFVGDYNDPFVLDTLLFNNGRTTTQMPASYGLGTSLSLNNKITLALDFVRTEWSNLTIDGVNEELNDATRLSFGTEFIPDYNSSGKGSGFKRVRYRGGLSAEQTRLNVDGEQAMRYGINFGIGVPLVTTRSTSVFNFGVEFANRGNTNIGISENYVNLFLGFTFTPNMTYDFWFLKRKYD